ncbi:MAG: sigma-70 family RNA polymerase sigma factor [Gemmiger sp.]|uniref:sigma-70 family RNA polymerase sigma factor n=1 Tax=Gemmiger sp. TaxID=2049027 RepID=UPI002E777766|nr:sigma-70 family RNA polymerase sigma factor [Gemmiger sp.]MEE0800096.1 sigma-70 family RNA polymerase sigma factor [Gemmiger sp.]
MQQKEEELLRRAQAGEESALAALIARMMPAIRKGAAGAVAPGLDFEDAVQEGLIGLFKAVRGYDPDKKVPFASYAAACIANAQQDARRRATRKKHAPLNDSVPLPEDSAAPGPEELAIASERHAAVLHRIETDLSPLERDALLASLEGSTVAQTARTLGCSPKAVENALSRARRKLRSTA